MIHDTIRSSGDAHVADILQGSCTLASFYEPLIEHRRDSLDMNVEPQAIDGEEVGFDNEISMLLRDVPSNINQSLARSTNHKPAALENQDIPMRTVPRTALISRSSAFACLAIKLLKKVSVSEMYNHHLMVTFQNAMELLRLVLYLFAFIGAFQLCFLFSGKSWRQRGRLHVDCVRFTMVDNIIMYMW